MPVVLIRVERHPAKSLSTWVEMLFGNFHETSVGPCAWSPQKWSATILRSLTLPDVCFSIDLTTLTGSPKSARSWRRYDKLMIQLLYLVTSIASNGTSISLNASSLSSSLNPVVVNVFILLPSRPRSLSTNSACFTFGSILKYLLPWEFVPTDTSRFHN